MEMIIALIIAVVIVMLILITISVFDLFEDRRKKAHQIEMAKLGYDYVPKTETEGHWVKKGSTDETQT